MLCAFLRALLLNGLFLSCALAASELDFELAGEKGFVRLSALPPGYTLVNFWRYDCPPCVKELPELARVARRGQIRVVTVALQRPSETLLAPSAVQEALKPPVLALYGPGEPRGLLGRFGNFHGGLPFTVLLSPDRQVCARKAGLVDDAWIDREWVKCMARG